MSTSAEHEMENMGEEHKGEEKKTPEELEKELESHRERLSKLMGSGDDAVRQVVERHISQIERDTHVAEEVNQGEAAQDRVELQEALDEQGGANDDAASRQARDSVAAEAGDRLGYGRTKQWYTRWKFWTFLATAVGTASATGATIFAGLALRQARPDSPDYEAIKAAREQLEYWRELSDRDFWSAFTGYVRDKKLALETQAHLMILVEKYFPSAFVPLRDGEVIRLRGVLVTAYYGAVAQGPDVPSTAIYQRLADGLQGARASDGQAVTLLRAQCADIALMALAQLRVEKGE